MGQDTLTPSGAVSSLSWGGFRALAENDVYLCILLRGRFMTRLVQVKFEFSLRKENAYADLTLQTAWNGCYFGRDWRREEESSFHSPSHPVDTVDRTSSALNAAHKSV